MPDDHRASETRGADHRERVRTDVIEAVAG
jgi:hypothetical protein